MPCKNCIYYNYDCETGAYDCTSRAVSDEELDCFYAHEVEDCSSYEKEPDWYDMAKYYGMA